MKPETLVCLHCGAPYREIIPAGTVQVKCKYCGGAILVPAYLGGPVQRCPNHPDVLAVGLCNDCGGSYCDSCLSLYNVEHGTLHLCPNCFKVRETDKATIFLIIGGLVLLGGFLFMAFAPSLSQAIFAGVFFIGVFALPLIAWGIYRTTHLPKAVTIKERNEAIKREMEFRKTMGSVSSKSLYGRLLSDLQRSYGPMLGTELLERRISYYVLAGKTRREALITLALEQGYDVSQEQRQE